MCLAVSFFFSVEDEWSQYVVCQQWTEISCDVLAQKRKTSFFGLLKLQNASFHVVCWKHEEKH